MSSVPTSKIWGGLKSVGCADVILNGNKKPCPEWTGFLCGKFGQHLVNISEKTTSAFFMFPSTAQIVKTQITI
jgi:hypothetical protein